MEAYFTYIIESALCLSVFYILYLLFLRGETGFKFVRFYLISSIILSLLLPLQPLSIQLIANLKVDGLQRNSTVLQSAPKSGSITNQAFTSLKAIKHVHSLPYDYSTKLKALYFMVLSIILLRFLVGIALIYIRYCKSESLVLGHTHLVRNNHLKCSFSFFNFIFMNTWLMKEYLISVLTGSNIKHSL